MMLPILISVSVAPVSYFFWASAPLVDPASNANAATEATATLFAKTAMTFSLSFSISTLDVSGPGLLGRKRFYRALSIILPPSSQEKALREACEGLLL